jgi:hypothetical protein
LDKNNLKAKLILKNKLWAKIFHSPNPFLPRHRAWRGTPMCGAVASGAAGVSTLAV